MLLLSIVSVIEDDLYVPVVAGRTRHRNSLAVPPQPEAWPHERRELYVWRDAKRQLEALHALTFMLLDAVGVCAGELYLPVPQRREVQTAPRAWHPHERHLPAGTVQAHRVLDGPRSANALEHFVSPAHHHRLAKLGPVDLGTQSLRQIPVGLIGVHHLVRSEAQGLLLLPLVLGDADNAS